MSQQDKHHNMQAMDGNTAAAYISYAFTEVAAIYPITPSSDMSEHVDAWAAKGKKNIFGQTVLVDEMQSEGGAAGAMHGALSAGALSTSYTASQGLLLMIPNMYKMSGELLPGVLHVSARALSTHALSIFGDHQDVMATRQTGFAMIASGSVQEVMDLGAVSHLAAISSRIPFLHFFDGFRTSHEIQKIDVLDYDKLNEIVDHEAIRDFRRRSMHNEEPYTKGTAQNPDIYFQAAEISNNFYTEVPDIVNDYMNKISDMTGREYKPFQYYGHPEAQNIVIAMGSVTQTLQETIDHLVDLGEKVGMINVRLYRPFSAKYFFDVLPKTVKKIAVLDKTKEKGAYMEPLHQDIAALFYESDRKPEIVGGRYGLGNKNTTPNQMIAVFDNLKQEKSKNNFTVGIEDDVTFLSLPLKEEVVTEPKDTIKCKFWGYGSDGTVGANKNAIKIIAENTDLYTQAYFSYDSKKSGGVTISHLRFGNEPIKSTYLITHPDFISCSKQSYVYLYDLLKGLKEGGAFLLNTIWSEEELSDKLPEKLKKEIADKKINFYIINASKIAADIGLGGRINMIMQSAFFKLAKVLPLDQAVHLLKEAIVKSYGKKGEDIVNMNQKAVEAGIESVHQVEIPAEWSSLVVNDEEGDNDHPSFIKDVLNPINAQEGDQLPVSTFVGREAGEFPQGTSAYEKRGVALSVPHWIKENCIQCNQCSFICPHAAIRPFILDEKENSDVPAAFETIKATGKGMEDYQYRIQVSTLDCTGCGNCADICPSKQKSLVMSNFEQERDEQEANWNFAVHDVKVKDRPMDPYTVKGSQFKQPMLEFSGACAGCGETAYAKLMTQLYGDRMLVANASGCSSVWGGSAPSTVFCRNQEGKGPSWASSLFEDNAEYGYGMALANRKIREKIGQLMNEYLELKNDDSLSKSFKEWLENIENPDENKRISKEIETLLAEKSTGDREEKILEQIRDRKEFLVKKSVWVIGGDGWAYDIGYGGLDHVMATSEDINILVFDTEVYSNTGGQSSKSTPFAAVAKFAAAGKRMSKKDLGLMAMTYRNVYVAQVAIGANMNHFVKVAKEAESFNGPSLIICYAPCITHGMRKGMGKTVEQEKFAVETGYWHLWRHDPRREEEGLNPFVLDSKEPSKPFQDFIRSEIRYTSLLKSFPDQAEHLFEIAEEDAQKRYARYKNIAEHGL